MKILSIIWFLCFSNAIAAENLNTIKIVMKEVNNNAKILFVTKNPLDFSLSKKASTIALSFSKQYNFNQFQQLTKGLSMIKKVHIVNSYNVVLELGDENYLVEKISLKDTSGLSIKKNSPASASNNSDFKINVKETKISNIITFAWQKNVASAVFYRQGYLWIVFNEYADIKIDELKSALKNNNISLIPSPFYTILTIKGDNLANVKVQKDKFAWAVEIINNNVIATPATKIIQYKTPYSKGVFFPADNLTRKPLAMIDPAIGDKLQIILSYNGDTGVERSLNFVDFKVLSSAQGFVLQQLSDEVKAQIITPGIEVISSKIDEFVSEDKTAALKGGYNSSALPFGKYDDFSKADFLKQKVLLQDQIMKASENKNNLRFELVKLFLGNNLPYEAKGMLRYILMLDPDYQQQNQVKFVQGVINYLVGHYEEASANFNAIADNDFSLEDRQELDFWKNALALKLRQKNVNFDFLKFQKSFLSTYPKKLYYDFAYLDLENSINLNNLTRAQELLKMLQDQQDSSIKKYDNANLYYQALLILKNTNDVNAAIKIWQKIQESISDPFNRARAQFMSAKTLYEAKKININEAIEMICKARYAWHGDVLEHNMLDYLTNLYLTVPDNINALRMLKIIVIHFYKDIDLLAATAQMSQIFFEIFNTPNNTNNRMDDLEKIALFYEFRELTPIGTMGDDVVQSLVDKMIALDLLSRAGAILSHQIKFRLEGEEQLKSANKLVKIHLIDQNPSKALEVLDSTEEPNISPELKLERKHLRAQSLVAQNKIDEALKILKNDETDEGIFIKGEIYWQQNDFSASVALLEPFISKKAVINNKLNERESNSLLKLVLCYIKLGDLVKAQEVYQDFGQNIDEKQKQVLDFITAKDKAIDYQDVVNSIALEDTKNFLAQYKKELTMP